MSDAPSTDIPKYNRRTPSESEAAAVTVWKSLFPRIDQALDRINGPYVEVVEDRSSLRLDDRYLGPWRGGSLHRTAMAAAGDSLLSIRTHLERVSDGDEALPMSALYPVLRTAMECASLAIHILAPSERDIRLRRSYWIAAEDAKYSDAFMKDLQQSSDTSQLDKTKATIQSLIATRASLGDPATFTFPPVKYSSFVTGADAAVAADPAIDSRSSMSLIAWWKFLSGLSHGKQWAFLTALERSEAVVDAPNETALVRLTSPAAAVAVALSRAVEAVEVALRLYGQRSKAAWNQPEDATEPTPVPFKELGRNS